MGRMKEWLMEQEERGFWSVGDKYICADCIREHAVQAFIAKHSKHNECSYCRAVSSDPIAAHFDDVTGYIVQGLHTEWGEPNSEGVPWDGGWVGEVVGTYELLFWDVGLEVESEELRDDLMRSLGDNQWCKRDFYSLDPSQVLTFGWERFVRLIKHEARYVFMRCHDSEAKYRGFEEIPPQEFLDEFGRVLNSLNLYMTLPAGSVLHRIRIHSEDASYKRACELGPPPVENCIYSNRMSPAGIPMFYGAFDVETCVAETYNPSGSDTAATVGSFTTTHDLVLLDLTRLPPMPSLFEEGSRECRHNLRFLHGFLRDFAKPIAKDGREHIEYVPTQVVSEYVRHIHRHPDGTPINGIVFPSSKAKGKPSCVLFIDNRCVADKGQGKSETRVILVDCFVIDPRRYI